MEEDIIGDLGAKIHILVTKLLDCQNTFYVYAKSWTSNLLGHNSRFHKILASLGVRKTKSNRGVQESLDVCQSLFHVALNGKIEAIIGNPRTNPHIFVTAL